MELLKVTYVSGCLDKIPPFSGIGRTEVDVKGSFA